MPTRAHGCQPAPRGSSPPLSHSPGKPRFAKSSTPVRDITCPGITSALSDAGREYGHYVRPSVMEVLALRDRPDPPAARLASPPSTRAGPGHHRGCFRRPSDELHSVVVVLYDQFRRGCRTRRSQPGPRQSDPSGRSCAIHPAVSNPRSSAPEHSMPVATPSPSSTSRRSDRFVSEMAPPTAADGGWRSRRVTRPAPWGG